MGLGVPSWFFRVIIGPNMDTGSLVAGIGSELHPIGIDTVHAPNDKHSLRAVGAGQSFKDNIAGLVRGHSFP